MKYDTIIIGAGISGLVLANELTMKGKDKSTILVLEKEQRPGGLIATTKENGFICEWGPEGLRGTSENTSHVFRLAGIESLPSTEEAKKRYILKKGKLIPLPNGPLKAIFSSILSPMEKLRILKEPFIPLVENDESLQNFFKRRFGKGVLPLVDAFVSGIFGGDPNKLSVDYAFSILKKAERANGSVLKGLMSMERKSKKKKKPSLPFLVTPKGGMSFLLEQLAENVQVKYGFCVSEIEWSEEGYLLKTNKGILSANRIVVATGTQGISNIKINGRPPAIKQSVANIVVISLGYDSNSISNLPQGYGFLVPDEEKRFILGILFTSNIFSQKAPRGNVLLRCFVGGARHPEHAVLKEETIIKYVTKEVEDLFGVTEPPTYVSIQKHISKGIPQLNLGHHSNIKWKNETENANPNLYFLGSGWTSISCDGLIGEALKLADRILSCD